MCDKQPCSDSIRFWSLNQANLLLRLAFVPGPTQTQRWGDTRREGGVGVTCQPGPSRTFCSAQNRAAEHTH